MLEKYVNQIQSPNYNELLEKGIKILLDVIGIDYSKVDFTNIESLKQFVENNGISLNLHYYQNSVYSNIEQNLNQKITTSKCETLILEHFGRQYSFDIVRYYVKDPNEHKLIWKLKFNEEGMRYD